MKRHINEPWWGAWKRFGWGEKIPGLGLSKADTDKLAETHDKWILTVGKDQDTEYEIAAVTVQNLAAKYKSTFMARDNTTLYVIPQNELKKIQNENLVN
jgi:hypothetical protein